MSSKKAKAGPAPGPTGRTTHTFQAETRQVLDLMIHSLYSNKEIFLRELISNASDALDRLRFAGLSEPGLLEGIGELGIEVEADPEAGTLTVRDNGIGMLLPDVMENIGTIARSGTRKFLADLSTSGAGADLRFIGQFGVGFYSAFIVAERVTLLTRKAGEAEDKGVRWQSDGGGEYELGPEPLAQCGTSVILHLKQAERQFLEAWTLRSLINRYSDHIGFPIRLRARTQTEEKGKEAEWEQVNQATALWTLRKKDISDQQYQEFYRHLTHDLEDALCWAHNRVEGREQNYTTLLYIPGKAPLDMVLQREERSGLRLYVNRVFIMDAAQALLPLYLRFIRGVVDSQDLPLNVSRELLQSNELLGKIRAAIARRSLDMMERLAKDNEEAYRKFWQQFGAVLKEGVVEDFANREKILPLLRFASSRDESGDEETDLPGYVSRMQAGQDCIWYITTETAAAARNSPHLEVFRERGVEVLLLSDRVDEWMMAYLSEYGGKPFRAVSRGEIDLGALPPAGEAGAAEDSPGRMLSPELLQRVASALGDRVSEVRNSRRLRDSAACLVLRESDLSLHLQKMLRQAGQEAPAAVPVLELNPSHALIARLESTTDDEEFALISQVLFDQAVLADGGALADATGFIRRMNRLLSATTAAS